MILSKNKKGIEFMVELGVSLVLFTLIIITLLVIASNRQVNVQATISSEFAKFSCNTDLMNFLEFDAGDGQTYRELIQDAYAKNDSKSLIDQVKPKLNDLLGEDKWDMNIFYYDTKLPEKEGIALKPFIENITVSKSGSSESCDTLVPISCQLTENSKPEDCALLVGMVIKYV